MSRIISLLPLLLSISFPLCSMEKLGDEYCITYGSKDGRPCFTEYFSFSCPHCVALFREDFDRIKNEVIDTEEIFFEFHPIPLDMTTLQAMICLDRLTQREKRAFIEVMMDESVDDPEINVRMMKRAMELFEKPIEELDVKEFVLSSKAFQEAFEFLTQEDRVEALPSVSLDGVFYPDEVPDYEFIKKHISERKDG